MALDRGAALVYYGDSPLMDAAGGGHIEAMELLIARGADPNLPGHFGLTPLAWAIKEGQDEAAAYLRRVGATE